MKQLERLLFLQGNVCFFCRKPIPEGEASVEHLVATSNGGAKDDDNCIVCCKTVNAALGSLSVKAKLQAIVNQRNGFVCPHTTTFGDNMPAATIHDERLQIVVADLQKRGASRPRKVVTLRNTMNAVFQNKLSDGDLAMLLAGLQVLGYVTVDETKVTYALPAAAG
jgi:hypothetical protein